MWGGMYNRYFVRQKPSFAEKTRFLFTLCTLFLYEPLDLGWQRIKQITSFTYSIYVRLDQVIKEI